MAAKGTRYLVLEAVTTDTGAAWEDAGTVHAFSGQDAVRQIATERHLRSDVDSSRFRAVPVRNVTEVVAEIERNPTIKLFDASTEEPDEAAADGEDVEPEDLSDARYDAEPEADDDVDLGEEAGVQDEEPVTF